MKGSRATPSIGEGGNVTPWSHEFVLTVSMCGALAATVFGFCLLIGFADAGPQFAGGCLLAYACSAVALWRWPGSSAAIAIRLLFTVSGVALGAMVLRRVLEIQAEPGPRDCGLPTMAAMAFFTMVVMFFGLELASWIGWWQLRSIGRSDSELGG
jgi:hypothetical protein